MDVSSTQLARRLSEILDRIEHYGEEVSVIRNNHKVASIFPYVARMTALEALSDVYSVLSNDGGKDWIKDSRKYSRQSSSKVRNPWDM